MKRDATNALRKQGISATRAEEAYFAWVARKFLSGKKPNFQSIPEEDLLSEARRGQEKVEAEIRTLKANIGRLPPERAELAQRTAQVLQSEAGYLHGLTATRQFTPRFFGEK
ncbi:MAG: hypothetical protein Q8P02_00300 [Candidatus Micrarchaeota archaeon]|nr:hypothetical protein [Candidatus Micrarchaeota archaeon]